MATKKGKRAPRRQAKKKTPAPRGKAVKKKTRTPAPAAAIPRVQVPRARQLLADSALVSCPTRQYAGTIELDDDNGRAFLQMDNGAFLLMLDQGCTGVFDPQGVAAAYGIYRVNPGRNGELICQGFLHLDGTGMVLHVVR
jgi:hypothetical protein